MSKFSRDKLGSLSTDFIWDYSFGSNGLEDHIVAGFLGPPQVRMTHSVPHGLSLRGLCGSTVSEHSQEGKKRNKISWDLIPISLPSCSIDQSKSQNQPRFNGWGNGVAPKNVWSLSISITLSMVAFPSLCSTLPPIGVLLTYQIRTWTKILVSKYKWSQIKTKLFWNYLDILSADC